MVLVAQVVVVLRFLVIMPRLTQELLIQEAVAAATFLIVV